MNEHVAVHGSSNDAVVPPAQSIKVSLAMENGDKPVEKFESISSLPFTMSGLVIYTYMIEVTYLIK